MPLRNMLKLVLASTLLAAPLPALAWGHEGHEVIATIARGYLTPAARAKVDAMLATDTDTLTGPDMIARSTWADAWRSAGHRETASWHFVDVELDHPDLASACFSFPPQAQPPSAGPAQDCVVDKVDAFAAELADAATPAPERLLALKYLLHFVGDLHQPLHAADNQDRGGNCVTLSLDGGGTMNLHAWWDTIAVQELGPDTATLAATLAARITPADRQRWEQGTTRDWALESFGVARAVAYQAGSAPGCGTGTAPVTLPAGYDAAAQTAAAVQLERAGVRLALVLNRALDGTGLASPSTAQNTSSVGGATAKHRSKRRHHRVTQRGGVQ